MSASESINDKLESKTKQSKHDYWIKKIQDFNGLQLPKDILRSETLKDENFTVSFLIPKALLDQIKANFFEDIPSNSLILFAALRILLYRYSNQKDFFVNTTNTRFNSGNLSQANGSPYLNPLPIRFEIDGAMNFEAFTHKLKGALDEARSNDQINVNELINLLGGGNEQDLSVIFSVIFDYQNNTDDFPSRIDLEDFNSTLFFGFIENDVTIKGTIIFNTDQYCHETIQNMADQFIVLLESIKSNPSLNVGKLNIVTKEEEILLLSTFNNSESPLLEGKTILDLFENQVLKNPNAVAVEFEGDKLTYSELENQSNQLAHFLIKHGLQQESPVPICIERSLEMVIAIFGILKSGGAYVPIDPEFPKERIDFMLEDAQADFVLCASDTVHKLPGSIKGILLDEEMGVIQKMPLDKPTKSPSSENLAYIIYTSGSTGKPKGAMVNHGNLYNFSISLTKIAEYDSSSRQLAVATYIFDAFCLELFVPLINGGCVILVKKEDAMDGFRLAQKLAEVKPTHMQSTPSGWQLLLNSGWKNPEGIKMATGGEALLGETKNQLAQTGKLWNLYGPTETTITSLYKQMSLEEKVSIGKPIDNTVVYVLGPEGALNPVGIPGELCIGGRGVGRGYLNRPELTSEKFIPNPFSKVPNEKIYKTGDLVRWLPDGNIEYLGRMDDQVKIRGYRIELGEIETVLLLHPSIKQTVIIAKEYGQGDKRLIGYVVCNGAFDRKSVSSFLKSKLPEYMVPSIWMELEKLPLTFTGKIDRKALPDVGNDDLRIAEFIPPRTTIEKKLATVWQDILGLGKVGIVDDFFALGGNSLLAMRIVAAVRKDMDTELSIRDLFLAPTVEQLALILESRNNGSFAPSPKAVVRTEVIPLSFNQQAIWFIHQMEGSIQYHIPLIFNVRGNLDISALEETFKAIVNRHEVLRTVIMEKDGRDCQKVLEPNLWKLDRIEIQSEDPHVLQNEIARLINVPFDLRNDYMIRASIIKSALEDYHLVITMHHIASDGWSANILKKELVECYQAITQGKPIPLAPLPLQYIDYTIWQRNFLNGDSIQRKLNYWKSKLQNVSPLQLQTDFARPTEISREGGTVRFSINKELISDLSGLGLKYNATLFMTLFSAFEVLIYRYTGQVDICIGTPIAGRDYQEFENLIGFFVNSIPLRVSLESNMRFDQLLSQVQLNTLDAFDNSEIPFEQIVEALEIKRDLSRNPIFQVFFALQNLPNYQDTEGSTIWSEEVQEKYSSRFDLSFDLTEVNGAVEGVIEFSKALFRRETIERMAGHYCRLLESIRENPTDSIGKFEILTDFEKSFILENLNNTQTHSYEGETILDLFDRQVLRNPDSISVEFEGKLLTYKELDDQSNQLAYFLIKNGLQPESPVPICMDRSLEKVIAIFGILKSGGAFVPIDPALPKDRIDYMIEDTKADFVVCTSVTAHNLSRLIKRIIIEEIIEVGQSIPLQELPKAQTPENLAYIIYTSGSTGLPKGVMIEHQNVVNFLKSMSKNVEFGPSSSILSVTTYSFDIFYLELFLPLVNGGKVFLVSREVAMDGFSLSQKLSESKPTHMQATPSGWQLLLNSGWKNPEQIKMLVGGEALGEDTKNALAKLGTLWNMYGPTETTIWSTFKQMDVKEKVSIGKPIDNTFVYILGPDRGLNPVGIPGELCIGGKGVGRGYLNRPELTSEKFLSNPYSNALGDRMYRTGDLARWLSDGSIEYLGRMDYQVKIRGYRIELGEIESVLLLHPNVKQAVVLAKDTSEGQKMLVGYVVCHEPFDKESVNSFLRSKLPEYMVPVIWMELKELPLTFNGKINRNALPDAAMEDLSTVEFTPPKTTLEKQLANVWQKLLGVENVGTTDDFFELGGQSLLAMRTAIAIRKEIGVEVSVNQIFKYPNILELAKAIENSNQDKNG